MYEGKNGFSVMRHRKYEGKDFLVSAEGPGGKIRALYGKRRVTLEWFRYRHSVFLHRENDLPDYMHLSMI